MKKPLTPEEFARMARGLRADQRTPYAFEKRIMARLGDAQCVDATAVWSRGLWRAVGPCLGVMVASALFSMSYAGQSREMEIDLEAAVVAPAQAFMDSNL
jgi:hypothetical protein